MKYISWVMGGGIATLLIIVMLFSTVQLVAFDLGHYEKEYRKYDIPQDTEMSLEDLIIVTENMLEYLKGNRETLDMVAKIEGANREVFNQKEKDHMVDVQKLFMEGYRIRNYSIIFILVLLIALLFWDKGGGIYKIFRCLEVIIGLIIGGTVILSILLYIDFNKYFTIFHHIFFTNDLWLLNPKTDWLIRIVPEPFFFDTAIKIVTYFIIEILILLGVSIGATRYLKRN